MLLGDNTKLKALAVKMIPITGAQGSPNPLRRLAIRNGSRRNAPIMEPLGIPQSVGKRDSFGAVMQSVPARPLSGDSIRHLSTRQSADGSTGQSADREFFPENRREEIPRLSGLFPVSTS